MKEQSLNRVTLLLLYAVMAVGLLFTISLPWALPRILRLGLNIPKCVVQVFRQYILYHGFRFPLW